MGERGSVQYPRSCFLSLRTFQAPFLHNKKFVQRGEGGVGLYLRAQGCSCGACQAGFLCQASSLPYKPEAANVRQARRSHAK